MLDEQLLIFDVPLGRPPRAAAFRVLAADRSTVLVIVEATTFISMAFSSSRDEGFDLAEAMNQAAIEYFGRLIEQTHKLFVVNQKVKDMLTKQLGTGHV